MAKILVADDDEDLGMIISQQLSNAGHQVLLVSDGMKAIHKAEEGFFDLAILDVRMPGCDGYAVCYLIKNSSKCIGTRVLLISGFSEDKIKIRDSKADAFLSKPFKSTDLVSMAEKLL